MATAMHVNHRDRHAPSFYWNCVSLYFNKLICMQLQPLNGDGLAPLSVK